ncbi:MAG: hypothetical protein DCF19_10350 [Pseudanabaena frigida]|uniref:Site-2 protease family protein n=1 Tax=Pseudanabaena frigida TaxID=945775 RepID=A0A2W4Y0R3_9CYAN|nr:MAG: hypothetical protein DCF19_10350 [Pseudanabaena frigida]
MGFEEAFVFVVAGCIASYRQRSLQLSKDRLQIIFLWILAVALPSLAIAWTNLNQAPLPIVFISIGFLLYVWIYRNWQPSSDANTNLIDLTPSEEKQVKDCFPSAIYQLKGLEYRPQEIYCRGNLRSQNHKYAYDTINQNIQKAFGDRFVCYLKESRLENLGTNFGESQNDRPNNTNYCFYLIPSSERLQSLPKTSSIPDDWHSWITSAIGAILTAFTLLAVGANIHRPEDLSLINLQKGFPYFLGVASILISRAIAQYYIAKKNSQQIDPPLLLPCIGGFGLLGILNTNFSKELNAEQNHSNQRKNLFDLVAIPAIVGLTLSTILLILGNWVLIPTTPALSAPVIAPSILMPNLATFDFKTSIFTNIFHGILQAISNLGKSGITGISNSDSIPGFSPLTLAGWTGLALSALQLMPFDLLDGGNLSIAMFGHRQAVQIARISRLILLAIAFLTQPWLRIYSLLLFLLPTPRPLILNESIEIGRNRDLLGMILIAIVLIIILPVPKSFLLANSL